MAIKERDFIDLVPADELERLRETTEKEETIAEKKTRELFDEINEKFAQQTGTITLHSENVVNEPEFLEKFASDRFSSEDDLLIYLRNTYGAGVFRIHGRVHGKKGIAINKRVVIGKTLEEKIKDKNLPMVIPQGGDNTDKIFTLILEGQRRQEDLIRALTTKPKNGFLEKLANPEILAIVVPAATGIISTILARQKKETNPMQQIKDVLQIVDLLKEEKDDAPANGMLESVAKLAATFLQASAKPKEAVIPATVDPTTGTINGKVARVSFTADDVADMCETMIAENNLTREACDSVLAQIGNDYGLLMQAVVILSDDDYSTVREFLRVEYALPDNALAALDAQRAEQVNEDAKNE